MKNILLLVFCLSFTKQHTQPYQQWASTYNGPIADDKGNSIVVDNACNSYVVGSIDASNGYSDYLIIKYNPQGNVLWTRTYNGSGNGIDVAIALKVDKNGNVYVTGNSQGKNTGYDIVTLKYNTDGIIQGNPIIYNSVNNKDDIVYNLDIDLVGNIYVIGSSYVSSNFITDGIIIKYSTNSGNNLLWMTNVPSYSFENNFLNLINKKSNGNILVTDYDGSSNNFYRIFELNPNNGNAISIYNSGLVSNWNIHGTAIALMVDYTDAIYVLSSSPTNSQYARIAKYTTNIDGQTGNIMYDKWTDRHISSGTGSLLGIDSKIDLRSGRIYVLARLQFSESDFLLWCYDLNLEEIWTDPIRFDQNSNQNEVPISMSLVNNITDPGIILTGNNGQGDILIFRYNMNGNRVWEVKYDCGNFGADVVSSMSLDKYDNVYLTGYSSCDGNEKDVKTLKYCQSIPPSIITSNSSNKICKGANLSLSVSTCSSCTYRWSNGESTPSIVVAPLSNTSYKVTVTDPKCCESVSAPFEVTIINKPVTPGLIVGETEVCAGSQFNVYKIQPVANATSYKWFAPNGEWIGNSTTESISYKAGHTGGILKVIAINACGSSDTSRLSIVTKSVPQRPGSISGEIKVCEGIKKIYKIFSVQNATNYRWEIIPTSSDWKSDNSKTNSVELIPGTSSIRLRVYAINVCGESQPQELDIHVEAIPGLPSIIKGANSVCPETANSFSISPIAGANKYKWVSSNLDWMIIGPIDKEVVSFRTTNTDSKISVFGHNDYCNVDGPSQTLHINVRNVDATISRNNNTLIANANGANYQWLDCSDFNNQYQIIGETNKVISVTKSGSYRVIVSQDNCVDTSDCFEFFLSSISQVFNNNIKVFPNPNHGEFTIQGLDIENGFSSIELYDNTGREVLYYQSEIINSTNLKVRTEGIPSGVYFLKVNTSTSRFITRIVIK